MSSTQEKMSVFQTIIKTKDFISYNKNNDVVKVHNITDAKKEKKYTHIRYKKENLEKSNEPGDYYMNYKSIIMNKNDDVISYGIPRAVEYELFIQENNVEDCIVEEFVEGTMITVFYDNSTSELFVPQLNEIISENPDENVGWNISTRGSIGAKNSFYKSDDIVSTKSFSELFIDCAKESNLDLSKLDKNYCYNFVIKHTANRVVNMIKKNSLYLISVYKIENENNITKIEKQDSRQMIATFSNVNMYSPTIFEHDDIFDWDDMTKRLTFDNSTVNVFNYDLQKQVILMGYVIKNIKTGKHTKIRNPVYFYMRELRGNQPKLEHHYLALRKDKRIQEFLHVFPEYQETFNIFYKKIANFTNELNQNYVELNITKKRAFNDVDYELRNHINAIHYKYRKELRDKGLTVQKDDVIQYVNNLHPSQLMFALNFKKRKTNNEEKEKECEI